MRKSLIILVVAIAMITSALTVLAGTALADTGSIELERQIINDEPGSAHELFSGPVPADIVGEVCDISATGNNNKSVHPGNNLKVSSGGDTVTLSNVERAPNASTPASGSLLMGEAATVTLVLGAEGVYSAEFRLTFDCREVPETTTTTTAPAESTTTIGETTTTTMVETTTTAPDQTTTTESGTTTTSEATTSTSAPKVTSTTDVCEGDNDVPCLPRTGFTPADAFKLGLSLFIAGGLVLLATRRELTA